MEDTTIVLAGATGNLGARIARALRERRADVRAVVRRGTAADKLVSLREAGVAIVEVDFGSPAELKKACEGSACVVSALSGLWDVIVEAQTALLDAAIEAGVPRFIPSDYSIDFNKLPVGSNRNLDLRRVFKERLDAKPIAATSVYNGAFADMLTGQAPIVLFKLRRVLYWGDADQRLDFTTIDDTASFTARAALDAETPRALHIAGDRLSARDLAAVMSEVSGKRFGLVRGGGLSTLETIIKVTRAVFPENEDLYPPWQGMQYLDNMFSGLALDAHLDNDRYADLRWTTARDVLARNAKG